jgi:hypothetical protein
MHACRNTHEFEMNMRKTYDLLVLADLTSCTNVRMYVCVHTNYVKIYVCMHTPYVPIYVCMHTPYVQIHVCMHTCTNTHKYEMNK